MSASENLKIIRGSVSADGARLEGAGFSVSKAATGIYQINFSSSFSDKPTLMISMTPFDNGLSTSVFYEYSTGFVSSDTTIQSRVVVKTFVVISSVAASDLGFSFIAIGPR